MLVNFSRGNLTFQLERRSNIDRLHSTLLKNAYHSIDFEVPVIYAFVERDTECMKGEKPTKIMSVLYSVRIEKVYGSRWCGVTSFNEWMVSLYKLVKEV